MRLDWWIIFSRTRWGISVLPALRVKWKYMGRNSTYGNLPFYTLFDFWH